MHEVWLRANRRALWMGMIAPALFVVVGAALLLTGATIGRVVGAFAMAAGLLVLLFLVRQMRQPRLAFEPGYLLVYLRLGSPIRVPIGVVECFFLGSGPLKLSDHVNAPFRTVGLIVRLAEKAKDWSDRPVKPALGRWHESYILIHGAWCEPLSLEVVSRLNVRLHQIQHGGGDSCQSTNPLATADSKAAVAADEIPSPAEKSP